MNHVSKLLRGNIVAGVVTTLVISSVDFVRMFQGEVSATQLFKSFTSTASGVAGGTGGWIAGAAGGAVVGSVIPIVGTTAGGIIGGLVGSFSGGTVASKTVSAVLDQFIEDDAKRMLSIIEKIFGELAFDYLLNTEEANQVIDEFKAKNIPKILRKLHASSNKEEFARNELEPIIVKMVEIRQIVVLPTDEQLIHKLGQVIEEISAA